MILDPEAVRVVAVDDVLGQIVTTTGPIGTLLVGGLMWLRGKLAKIEQYDKRLAVIEAHLGIHPVVPVGQPPAGE